MDNKLKMLNAVRYVGGAVLSLGILLFMIGFFNESLTNLTYVGIGTIMGAVFIFIMGIFLAISEELVERQKERI